MMGDITSNEIDIVSNLDSRTRQHLVEGGTFEADELVSKISFEEFNREALPKCTFNHHVNWKRQLEDEEESAYDLCG